jgi:hypothetical protein
MNHATPTTCDPRPFLRHMALATAWCRHNSLKATERQVLRMMGRYTATELERMIGDQLEARHAAARQAPPPYETRKALREHTLRSTR